MNLYDQIVSVLTFFAYHSSRKKETGLPSLYSLRTIAFIVYLHSVDDIVIINMLNHLINLAF